LLAFHTREIVFSGDAFEKEIASARTFGFLHEVEALKNLGLAQGGSLDNAVVLDHERVLNQGGLRYEDECVRHKILDTVGDLMLTGAPIIGHFVAQRSGHALNHRLVRKLLDTPEAYTLIELNGNKEDRLNGFKLPAWVTPKNGNGLNRD
jgi:UDP-3-O-[3-hydroxymyristoyl] N-acetylglucosamine deacetylase